MSTPISNELFQNSLRHVRRELKILGFGNKQIMETKVSRTIIPSMKKQAYFYEGEIFIPILQSRKGIRDKLRHEYGHAFLYYFPKIKTARGFVHFGRTVHKHDYVSAYAMNNPDEDFCETFMKYLKHKGKAQQKYSQKLLKKWNFIRGLRGRCSS